MTTPHTRFLEPARRLNTFATCLGAVLCLAVGQALIAVPGALALGPDPTARARGFLLLVSFIGVWVLVWAWLRFVEHRGLRSLGLWRSASRDLLVGAGVALLVLVVVVSGMVLLGGATVSWASPTPATVALVVAVLVLFALQGGAEEITLRGMVLQSVAARWGLVAGLVIESLLFSVLHLANPGVTVLAGINVAGFGLLLGLLVLVRGNLWVAIGFHAVWNWAEGMVLGLDISGMDFGLTMWEVRPGEDSVTALTGGAFGPEGSAVTTAVLAICIVGLLVGLARRRT